MNFKRCLEGDFENGDDWSTSHEHEQSHTNHMHSYVYEKYICASLYAAIDLTIGWINKELFLIRASSCLTFIVTSGLENRCLIQDILNIMTLNQARMFSRKESSVNLQMKCKKWYVVCVLNNDVWSDKEKKELMQDGGWKF